MPRIAFFFGISIYMYIDDHGKRHCHAASFGIDDGSLLAGQMPPKQEKKIREWILANKGELNEKWTELSG